MWKFGSQLGELARTLRAQQSRAGEWDDVPGHAARPAPAVCLRMVGSTPEIGAAAVREHRINQYLVRRSVVLFNALVELSSSPQLRAKSFRARGTIAPLAPPTTQRLPSRHSSSSPLHRTDRVSHTASPADRSTCRTRHDDPATSAPGKSHRAREVSAALQAPRDSTLTCHHAPFTTIVMQQTSSSSVEAPPVSLLTPIGELARTQWQARA